MKISPSYPFTNPLNCGKITIPTNHTTFLGGKTVNEKIIEKVQKLLNLAGNNSNELEAQAAMLKAQQLMAEYHLDRGDLETPKNEKEVKVITVNGNQSTRWAICLGNIISRNFRCSLLRTPKGLMFIGLKEDVAIAVGVYKFAVDTLDRNMRKLRRQYRKAGKSTDGISQDYAAGFISGLNDKYNEQVEKNGWALVLVKDALVVAKTDEIKNPGKVYYPKEKARRGDVNLYARGYVDGKSLGDNQRTLKEAVS